jgi:uncharacterized membrane protein YphA (DoxX/SURF4 family)
MVTVIVLTMVAYMMCHTHWVVVVKNIPTHTHHQHAILFTLSFLLLLLLLLPLTDPLRFATTQRIRYSDTS